MVWLITGAGGQLGSVLLGQLVEANEPTVGIASPRGPVPDVGSASRLDFTDGPALADFVLRTRPDVIVHAGAISAVAAAHQHPETARRVNELATRELAVLGQRIGARFLYVSTDMVFDGEHAPYTETATPLPLSEYGRSKHGGERAALAVPGALVVRLPLLYGVPAAARSSTFLDQVRVLRQGGALRLFHDELRTPLSLEDAARAIIRAAKSDVTGTLHAGGPERLSRLEMGQRLAEALGVESPRIESASRLDVPAPEPRARDLSLDSSKFTALFGVAPGRPMREALATMKLRAER